MEIKFANVLMKKFMELCSVIWDSTQKEKTKAECFKDGLKEDYPDDWELIFNTAESLLARVDENFGKGQNKKSCIVYQPIKCKNGDVKIIEVVRYLTKKLKMQQLVAVTLIKILNSKREWESEYQDCPLVT